MKAIAEYFRDLAADDRYFGAEPPQPDADMLARIAQKEISRRVDARADGTGIHLRAGSTTPALAPAQDAPDAQPVPEAEAPAAPLAEPAPEPVQEPIPVAETVEPAPVQAAPQAASLAPTDDALAAKLARIRAVVDRNDAVVAEPEQPVEVPSADLFDQHADTPAPVEATAAEAIDQAIDLDEDTLDAVNTALSDDSADTSMVQEFMAAPVEDMPVETMPAEDIFVPEETNEIPADWNVDQGNVDQGQDFAEAEDQPEELAAETLDLDAPMVEPQDAPQGDVWAETPAADLYVEDQPVADAPVAQMDVAQMDDVAQMEPVAEDTWSQDSIVQADAPADGAYASDAPADDTFANDDFAFETSEQDATIEDAPVQDAFVQDAPIQDAIVLPVLPEMAMDDSDDDASDDSPAMILPEDSRIEMPIQGEAMPEEAADAVAEALTEETTDETDEQVDVQAEDIVAETPAPSAEDDSNVFRTIDWDSDDTEDDPEDADDATIQNILGDLHPRHEAAVQAAASGPVTRVIKVKRAELEKAIATGSLEEVSDETPAEAPAAPKSSLSPEDEADLQAELDAVAAELAEAQAALNPPDEDDAPMSTALDRPRERGVERIDNNEPDVSRLMAEADSKMDEPETSSRREAYSHLRAAVAAAEAEETLSPETEDQDAADAAYREDLASVVRPRRPEGTALARPRRPAAIEARPAPLKLVAEQRVDADTILPQRGPIRPRRVAAESQGPIEATEGQPGGFAAFAHEVGARDLHELLEAAAAYMSFVEGWDQFSRPQLMTRVKQVNAAGFNREDGLRTFGQLLREGKIEKTSGGRFTASDQIGYRPAHQAAG